MGRALGAIRGGATARLEGDFPAEIQPLATELNALLDHNEALVERARTHVGNLAHGLKTPLSVLINEARGSDGPLAELVRRQVALMRRQVDHHLARARAIATGSILGARTDVLPVLRDLERTLGRIYAEKALAIEVGAPPELAFRGARQDLEEMLGNLMDNACKWAAAKVTVRAPKLRASTSGSRSRTTGRACRRRAVPRCSARPPPRRAGAGHRAWPRDRRRSRPALWRPPRPGRDRRGRPARAAGPAHGRNADHAPRVLAFPPRPC